MPEQITIADHRIRDERFACALQSNEQVPVQRVQVRSTAGSLPIFEPKASGHVAKRGDAQLLAEELEGAAEFLPRRRPSIWRGECRRQSSACNRPRGRASAQVLTPSTRGKPVSSGGNHSQRSSSPSPGLNGSRATCQAKGGAQLPLVHAPARNRPRAAEQPATAVGIDRHGIREGQRHAGDRTSLREARPQTRRTRRPR